MPLSLHETRERLRELELFSECDDRDLERVAALARDEARFEPGDVIYKEGEPARDCYVIVDGEAEVTVSGRYLRSIGEGESVGEMGLLDRGPRTATVVARTPVAVQVIQGDGFDRLLDEVPSVTRALLRQVSRRLASSSQTVARLSALADETTLRVGDETGRVVRTDGIGSMAWRAIVACPFSAAYGGSPVSISNQTHPRLYTPCCPRGPRRCG